MEGLRQRPFPIFLILAYCLFSIVSAGFALVVAVPTFLMGGLAVAPFLVVIMILNLVLYLWLFVSVFYRNTSSVIAASFLIAVELVGKIVYAFSADLGPGFVFLGLVSLIIPATIFWYLYTSYRRGVMP